MITCDESGKIVVKVDDAAYDLSNSDQYADFLLWATSPDEKVVIGDDAFKVDNDIPEEHRAKASRYAIFLIDFAHKRQNRLTEMSETHTTEQREKGVKAFIECLQSEEV